MLLLSRRTLAELPPPSPDIFTLRPPWSPVSARTLTETLNVDHGLLGVWRMRGLGPQALPPGWTKGRSLAYRVDAINAWLAARHGQTYDIEASHRDYLMSVHMPPNSIWVPRMAEAEGLVIGDVRFTRQGFRAYIATLVLESTGGGTAVLL